MKRSSPFDEEIRQLFRKHVPEAAEGTVELVAVAREPGRVMVAVRSRDKSVDPVGTCAGVRGVHPKSISRELGGEKVSIVLWSESPENFILSALAPFGPATVNTPKVTLDAAAHQARIEVSREMLTHLSSDDGARIRLASRLVGWDIRLVCQDQH